MRPDKRARDWQLSHRRWAHCFCAVQRLLQPSDCCQVPEPVRPGQAACADPAHAVGRAHSVDGAVRRDRTGDALANQSAARNRKGDTAAAVAAADADERPDPVERAAATATTTSAAHPNWNGLRSWRVAWVQPAAQGPSRAGACEPETDLSSLPIEPPTLPDCAIACGESASNRPAAMRETCPPAATDVDHVSHNPLRVMPSFNDVTQFLAVACSGPSAQAGADDAT